MTRIILTWMFRYCLIQIVDIATGHPLRRLAHWIAMYGEPERDQWQPTGYVEGGWK